MSKDGPSKDKEVRAVIYTNVSSQKRVISDDHFETLERVHTERCQATADELDLKVIDEYHDLYDSDRNNLYGLISLIGRLDTDRNVDVILVPGLDALGRKRLEREEILEVITGCGVKVLSADGYRPVSLT